MRGGSDTSPKKTKLKPDYTVEALIHHLPHPPTILPGIELLQLEAQHLGWAYAVTLTAVDVLERGISTPALQTDIFLHFYERVAEDHHSIETAVPQVIEEIRQAAFWPLKAALRTWYQRHDPSIDDTTWGPVMSPRKAILDNILSCTIINSDVKEYITSNRPPEEENEVALPDWDPAVTLYAECSSESEQVFAELASAGVDFRVVPVPESSHPSVEFGGITLEGITGAKQLLIALGDFQERFFTVAEKTLPPHLFGNLPPGGEQGIVQKRTDELAQQHLANARAAMDELIASSCGNRSGS